MTNLLLDRLVSEASNRIARRFPGAAFETPMPSENHRELFGKAGWEGMLLRLELNTWELWDLRIDRKLVARGRHDEEEELYRHLAAWP